jgi:hypothetical protein
LAIRLPARDLALLAVYQTENKWFESIMQAAGIFDAGGQKGENSHP